MHSLRRVCTSAVIFRREETSGRRAHLPTRSRDRPSCRMSGALRTPESRVKSRDGSDGRAQNFHHGRRFRGVTLKLGGGGPDLPPSRARMFTYGLSLRWSASEVAGPSIDTVAIGGLPSRLVARTRGLTAWLVRETLSDDARQQVGNLR